MTQVICPVPKANGGNPYENRQPFTDGWRVFNDMVSGSLRWDEPCATLGPACSHAQCLASIATDPGGATERLFLYTMTDNENPGDPREHDFERWLGPVPANAVAALPWGERWYRIEPAGSVARQFPHAVLGAACATGDSAAFEGAIAAGADIHFSDGERGPLFAAIKSGRMDFVDRLIALGLRGERFRHPSDYLSPAVYAGDHAMLARLLALLRPDAETLSGLVGGSADVPMAEMLVAAGADPRRAGVLRHLLMLDLSKGTPARYPHVVALLNWLVERGADIDAPAEYGGTPLHQAIAVWHYGAVHRLVELGASLDVKDSYNGHTPAQAAAAGGFGEQFDAIVRDVHAAPPAEPMAAHSAEVEPAVAADDAARSDRPGLLQRLFGRGGP